jgi:hypothetical protein
MQLTALTQITEKKEHGNMGLDMYLQRQKIMSKEAFADAYDNKLSGVIYWRKANAIHKYFVDYGAIQPEGTPNVGYYYIDRTHLINLIERITSILNGDKHKQNTTYFDISKMEEVSEEVEYNLNKELAAKLLPTESGFFFGSTDYDDWYHRNLVHTLNMLKAELAAVPNQETWYYYASW